MIRITRVLALALLAVAATACGRGTPADSTTLVFMGTTDVHGWLLPWNYEAGEPTEQALSLLAPLVDSIREAHPGRTLLVDSGDLLQGSILAAAYTPLAEGEEHPVITAMNLMGYDAAAIGNHEFNFGIDHLNRSISGSEFPFLAANVVNAGSGQAPYAEYVIVPMEAGDHTLRVGITAVLPPGVSVWDRDHVEGRLEFHDILESLARVVPLMREQGADLVVVAAHNSFEGTSYDWEGLGLGQENRMGDVARQVPGIDVVFLGHSHRELADTTVNGVLFLQGGARASSLAVATLQLTREDSEWRVTSKRGALLRPDLERSHPAMEAALAVPHDRALAMVNRVLGVATAPFPAGDARIRDGALLDFVNRVQLQVTGAQLAATSSFSLDAGIPEGEVTVGHMARVYPYDNNLLRAVEITGSELRAYLEHSAEYFLPCVDGACERLVNPDWPGYNFDVISGVEYTLDLRRPLGDRVVQLDFQGAPVRDDQRFTLALNNYRQGGGGGFPAVSQAPVRYEGNESLRDLLIQEIERAGTIRPEDYHTMNWRIIPEEWLERAREEMRGRR